MKSKPAFLWPWIKALNVIVQNEPYEPVFGQELPVQVSPWLWISDEASIDEKMSSFPNLGITHVLLTNVMEPGEVEYFRSELEHFGINHHYVGGHDEEGYDMIENHWDECRNFLQHVYDSEGKVVVHCVGGRNRSGLIACAALMVFERITVLDVVKLVKRKRFTLLTNLSFQWQLCLLAAREGLLGPKPEGFSEDPPPSRRPPVGFSENL